VVFTRRVGVVFSFRFQCGERVRSRSVHFLGYLRKEKRSAMPNSDLCCGQNKFCLGSRYCAAALFSQVPKSAPT